MFKLLPARESLVSDIPAGDGKLANIFYGVLPACLSNRLFKFPAYLFACWRPFCMSDVLLIIPTPSYNYCLSSTVSSNLLKPACLAIFWWLPTYSRTFAKAVILYSSLPITYHVLSSSLHACLSNAFFFIYFLVLFCVWYCCDSALVFLY